MIPKEKRPAWWDVVKELEQITGCPRLAFETNAKTAWEIQFAYWLAEENSRKFETFDLDTKIL